MNHDLDFNDEVNNITTRVNMVKIKNSTLLQFILDVCFT